MKILQVMAGADHGGAEMAFVDMCAAMKEAGEDVLVFTRPNKVRVPLLEKAGLDVRTAPFGGMADLYTRWRMGKLMKEFNPHIVQTWMSRAAQKTPNWKSVQSTQRYLVVSRLGGYYKVKNYKSSDYFTTITPDIKRHLVDGGIEADRIKHINNFAETEEDVVPVRRSDFETPDEAVVLLTLARLHKNKALDILLQAIQDQPDVYLWMAGEGPEREALQKQAADLGISDRVRFLGWRTDRAALLRAADICIFASRIEPFGTVFAQAWSEKTPVIVSDADGPRQFCRDGEDSLMVPRDDVAALATAIERLKKDKILQMSLVNAGYQRYLNEFTKEKSIAGYLDWYHEILKREGIF